MDTVPVPSYDEAEKIVQEFEQASTMFLALWGSQDTFINKESRKAALNDLLKNVAVLGYLRGEAAAKKENS